MELRHLRYFLAAAKREHLTHAAEALGISASTLSHQIRQLEDDLGTALFDRVGRGIALTEAGRVLRVHAQRAFAEVESARHALDELARGERGTLRIGVIHTFHNSLLPAVVAQFARRYPHVRLCIEEHPADIIEQRIAQGRLDLGIAFAPAGREDLGAERVFEEDLVLAVARSHPLARRRSVEAHTLTKLPVALLSRRFATRRLLDRLLASVVELEPSLEMGSVEALINMVRTGEFASILPARALERDGGIAAVRIHNPSLTRTAATLWSRERAKSSAAKHFAAMFHKRYG